MLAVSLHAIFASVAVIGRWCWWCVRWRVCVLVEAFTTLDLVAVVDAIYDTPRDAPCVTPDA